MTIDMKIYRKFICIAAAAAAFAGCAKEDISGVETPENGDKVLISVTLPETVGTKVDMNELSDGSALELKWEADDKIIVVSGDVSEEYTIVDGYTDKSATFEGNEVAGETFDIILSKSGADYRTRSYHAQTQVENGNCDHLAYDAWLTGVNTYTAIDFSSAWAADHGGSFHQNGVVKFRLKFPEGVTSVSELILAAPSQIFYADNDAVKYDNVHVSLTDGTLSEQIMTAYVMTSSNEVVIADDVVLTLTAVTNNGVYTKEFAPGKNLVPGKMNVIQLNDQNWVKAEMGTGTEADPYLLRTVSDLQGINGKEGYFKLMNDIDLTGVVWTPVCDGTKIVNFDGNGKTISNLTCSTGKASFFGKFKGNCANVSFTDATVEGTSDICGIVAGEANGNFSNIYVSGTVTSKFRRTGGIIGYLSSGSLTGCKAKVTVTSTSGVNIGGLIGQAYGNPTISDCHLLSDSNVAGASTAVGGIAGYSNGTISECTVKSSQITGTGGTVGGVVGNNVGTVTECTVNSVTVTAPSKAESAGFIVGKTEGVSTISKCAAARGSVTAYRMAGGIVGYVAANTTVENSYSHNCTIYATHRRAGGIVGEVAKDKALTVSNCYSTATCKAQYTVAGIVAFEDSGTAVRSLYSGCIAWNGKLEQTKAASTVPTFYSGAIIGNASRNSALQNCYRKSGLTLTVPDSDKDYQPVNQENCDGTTTQLTNGTYADDGYGWSNLSPYHGMSTDLATVSAVAKSLKWDETIWKLDSDLPTLL